MCSWWGEQKRTGAFVLRETCDVSEQKQSDGGQKQRQAKIKKKKKDAEEEEEAALPQTRRAARSTSCSPQQRECNSAARCNKLGFYVKQVTAGLSRVWTVGLGCRSVWSPPLRSLIKHFWYLQADVCSHPAVHGVIANFKESRPHAAFTATSGRNAVIKTEMCGKKVTSYKRWNGRRLIMNRRFEHESRGRHCLVQLSSLD